MKEHPSKPVKGLHTDFTPKEQPENTYRFALNAVDETNEGDSTSLINDESNEICASLPEGYKPIGKSYISDNRTALFLVNPATGDSEIGIHDSYCNYETIVNDSQQNDKLGFKIDKQIDTTYRLRRGCEDVVYFVDGFNNDRFFNFGQPTDFQDNGGNWDIRKFNLDSRPESIPNINAVSIVNGGVFKPGSYNIGISLLDADFNSTEVLNISDTIIIFNDKYTEEYKSITGSTTEVQDYFQYSETDKALEVKMSELDESYDYYRIYLISANTASGRISEITHTEPIPRDQETFILTGDNTPFEATEAEILTVRAIVTGSQHIEQIDNRLIRANSKGPQRDFCTMQKLASKIYTRFTTREVVLNNIDEHGNPKRGTIHEEQAMGYMPGEIYAMGIMYTFDDGTESPVFHIPGRNPNDLSTGMSADNEVTGQTYPDDNSCLVGSYWGKDSYGDSLDGQPVRHHRFPTRTEAGLNLYEENVILDEPTGNYLHSVIIDIDETYNDAYNYDSLWVRVKYDNAISGELNVEYIRVFPNIYINDGEPVQLTLSLPEIASDSAVNPYTVNQVKFVNSKGNNGLFFIDPIQGLGGPSPTITYISEPISNKVVEYTSEIMGFEFDNIELPEGAIGYHIVRMERTDEQKTVLDSGVMFPLMKDDKYEAFGAFQPDGTITRSSERWVLFNPEYLYENKQYQGISSVYREGLYVLDEKDLFEQIAEDAQPGTSYDPSISKRREKDEDGYDLHTLVRYTSYNYTQSGVELTNNVTDTKYLTALASVTMGGETVFNASGDNKIGVLEFDSAQGTTGGFPYVYIRRDLAAPYSNWRTGKYYKEHTTLSQVLASSYSVFNGDTYISPMTLTNSLFYDIRLRNRSAKTGVWRIIGGTLLIVLAVVATVFSLGLSSAATVALIAGGLSTIASGVNQASVRKAYQEEYEKGLKDTIQDSETNSFFGGNPPDDEVQYFFDILENIWFEGTVNMNWRVEPNYGPLSFQYSPDFINKNRINQYVLDKVSVVDTDNESGRLYKGFPTAEIYFVNKDYLRRNTLKPRFPLPLVYDCCSDCLEEFPQRVTWSEQSFQEELTDNYRISLANNYRDIEGETGPITDLFKMRNNLYIHSSEGLWHLPQNIQERITGDILSFVGTGDYFSIPPRKIVDDETGLSAGTTNKWATLKTPFGVYFVADKQRMIYHFTGNQLKPISSNGLFSWFKENIGSKLNEYFRETKDRNYPYLANPANKYGIGFHAVYDSRKERIIFTKRELIFGRDIVVQDLGGGIFVTPVDKDDYEVLVYEGELYIFTPYQLTIDLRESQGWIYQGFDGNEMLFTRLTPEGEIEEFRQGGFIADPQYIYEASWTLSYSLKNQAWRSFHSFLPNFYFHVPERFFSLIYDDNNIWKHNRLGHYQNYYGERKPFILDYISNSMPLETRIYNHVKFVTEAFKYYANTGTFNEERFITFNKALFYNTRQCSGELELKVKDTNVNDEDYLLQQIVNATGEILLDRNERDWTLNELRDIRIDYNAPIFNDTILSLQSDYFIDKIINTVTLDENKDWTQMESFRDKYLGIRFIFDNFDDIKLVVDYSIINEQKSFR
jgi:hypothetical protein